MKAYALKSGTQRTDSKQIASNIRRMMRLQLLIEVLQRTYRMLEAVDKQHYHAQFEPYIKEKSGRYLYRLKGESHPLAAGSESVSVCFRWIEEYRVQCG